MLKKLLLAGAAFILSMGFAFAQVDVNKADQAALDGIKGIGPTLSKAIIDERKKNGNFKDWADFESRVKGIGEKSSGKLSQAGLTVNGQSRPKALSGKNATKESRKESKPEASDAKKDKKADTKDGKREAKTDGKDIRKDEAKK